MPGGTWGGVPPKMPLCRAPALVVEAVTGTLPCPAAALAWRTRFWGPRDAVRAGQLSLPSPGDMELWSPSLVWAGAAAGLLPPPISPACALGLFIGLPFISVLFLPCMGKARGSDGEDSSLLCPTHRGRFCHQHCHLLPPPRSPPMSTSSSPPILFWVAAAPVLAPCHARAVPRKGLK